MQKTDNDEARRIAWTTYKNLAQWFDNWGRDLVELGFAEKDEEGNIVIPPEQLKNIVNFDETCLSLDGSQGNRGEANGNLLRSAVPPDRTRNEQVKPYNDVRHRQHGQGRGRTTALSTTNGGIVN